MAPPRDKRVSEEDLPWGEIVIEFGPDDFVPLQTGPALPPIPARSEPDELSIPFGTIIESTLDHEPTHTEPSRDRARPVLHGSDRPVPSPVGTARAGSTIRPEREAQPDREPVEVSSSFFEHTAGPPLGVMAIAVAVVVILFLLVQSP
jgi:hypothetical protein